MCSRGRQGSHPPTSTVPRSPPDASGLTAPGGDRVLLPLLLRLLHHRKVGHRGRRGVAWVSKEGAADDAAPFVARTRAEPLEMAPAPKVPLTESPSALLVPNRTVPPAGTSSEVALGSLAAPPPAKPKISTPTRIVSSVVFVQAKKVSRPPPRTTPGTDQRWKDGCP